MFLNKGNDIMFPNIGIELNDLGQSISVFGLEIAFYGIIIAIGVIAGYQVAQYLAKRSGQDSELYLDFALFAIISSIFGARLYYVIFAWDEFKDNPLHIFNFRTGGLAIYGGLIAGIICAVIYSRVKKINMFLFMDTCAPALLIGQAIGRWGNFFNREAFGKYYDGLFSMLLDIRDVHSDYRRPIEMISSKYAEKPEALERILEIRDKTVLIDGATYIQVHPTFLYESLFSFALVLFMILYTKHKKFDGEILLMYFIGYGFARFWIEGLRTDQLFLWGSPIAVSQVLSAALVLIGIVLYIYNYRKAKNKKDDDKYKHI